MSTTLVEHLNSYVPPAILRRIAADATSHTAAAIEHSAAAVLFADISGFTPLAETLARRGPAGAEALTQLLNDYLGQLVELVHAHGGEVLSFAGDALLAVWSDAVSGENLSRLTQRAAYCGLAIQAQLNNYEPTEGAQLRLRLGISAGKVKILHVGGVDDCWQFELAGEPLAQMYVAQSLAAPGDLVLDYAAWHHLGEGLSASARSEALDLGYRRLHEIQAPPPINQNDAVISSDGNVNAAVRGYVPQAVLFRLDADQTDWLAELRRVTVLFVNIKGLNYNSPAILDQVQAAVRAMQSTLARFEGSIRQLIVDNNGTVLIAAFGLPPRTHEDDAARAVQAALEIQAQLEKQGLLSSIGITTGRTFCGPIGNQRRREYALVGSIVNLAARLMQVFPDQILCDTATYQAAHSRVQFETLPPVTVKGRTDAVPVFRPQRENGLAQTSAPTQQNSMLGRSAEREKLSHRLDALVAGKSGVVLIEGEPGIGKSRMVADLLAQAKSKGCADLLGAGNAVEISTPYHAWRAVFSHILGVDSIAELQARRTHVLNFFESTPELATPELLRLVPLLNTILPLDFPENDLTAEMAGQVRADNTRDLLRRLLQAFAAKSPTVLILEDAHWLDSASWALALIAQQQVQPLLLVVSTRPLVEPIPAEYKQLLQANGAEQLKLEALPAANILDLVCQRLGITTLAQSVADLIQHKGQGNPFFSEELAYSLRESGIITISDGNCRVAPDISLDSVMLPDSVQGVITGRIDRLAPSQQLLLKAASVIGRVFPFKILRDVYPGKAETAQLPEYLEGLERLDITPRDAPEPNLAHIFKHIITQEVSYNLMLFAQRRELHQTVAQWYERAYTEDLTPYYSLLAYHWGRAEVRPKTIEYCEKAGEQALRDAAYREAVGFFEQALALEALETPKSDSSNRLRRARWERQLAEALIGLGRLLECRAHLEQAAILLQDAVPSTPKQLALGLTSQIMQVANQRVRPVSQAKTEDKTHFIEAARVYERLAQSYFHDNLVARSLYCSLHSLNLAEVGGPSPELARACASASITTGLVPLRRLSHYYDRRALEIAELAGELRAQAWVTNLSGLCSMNVGALDQARQSMEQSVGMAEELGDRRQLIESGALLSLNNHYAGRFAEANAQAVRLYEAAERNGDIQGQVWGFCFQSINLLVLDEVEHAAKLMEAALILLNESVGASLGTQERMEVYGALALVRLRQGEMQAARQAADEVLPILMKPPTTAAIFYSYTSAFEVYLSLCTTEQKVPAGDKTPVQQAARACAALRKFAHVFPLGQSRALLARGELAWLRGKPRFAFRAWRQALRAAERLNMPYDQGRAHLEIARHMKSSDPARRTHLDRACSLFKELGAVYDLKRAQAALSSGTKIA